MQIKHEKYSLGKSKNLQITSKDSDIKADIQLNINDYEINIASSISGIVLDTSGIIIKSAIIKLMNDKLEMLATTKTDSSGKYSINIIPASSTYIVLATYMGKLLEQSPSFSLFNKENKIINFTLKDDTNSLLGGISGTLVNNIGKALKGIIISLYKITDTNTDLIALTYSDFEGNFLFSQLDPSNYKIVTSSLDYLPYDEIITIENSKIYSFKKDLKVNPLINNGSISGLIVDNFNNGIINGDVMLYKIEDNNIKTPVAFCKTNSSGIYAFSNVPFGNYIVKSSASQNTNLENLITPSVKITSTLQLDSYNLSSGILENNASVDYLTDFVVNLGGKQDGSATLKVTMEKFGLYTLNIEYLAADFNRSLKLEVNGQDNGHTYKVPITSGWTIDNSKVFNISTILNEGENILKFHGDGINLAPNLRTVTFIFNETEKLSLFAITSFDPLIYNVSTGILGAGAKVNDKTTFTDNLGGPNDGYSNVIVDVKDAMTYYLVVKYLATSNNMKLKIDINNIKNDNIYIIPSTKNDNVVNALTFTVPILLNYGKNTIKFHGDGVNKAPSLQQFVLKQPPLEYQLTNGILENGAKIDVTENFVLNIGGTLNGSSTVSTNVNDTGKYKLFLRYVGTSSNLSLKIDVNGVNTGTIYKLPVTSSLNFKDCKTFSLDIKLTSGNNSLKFYGNNKDISPNLAYYNVQFNDVTTPVTPSIPTTIQENYLISNATLRTPATYDKNSNFVISLGGKNNGACSIGVMVKYTGQYVLNISYRNNNRKFKIDINASSTNIIYKTTGAFIDTFSTLIDLKEGKNIIKFYGTGFADELAPDLGDFTLNLNTPINLRLSDGIFSNGAKLLSSGIITSIGGGDEGSFKINYFTSENGEYILDLIFSGEGSSITIDINNNDLPKTYNIPAVKTTTVLYKVNVELNEGYNTINFYGNNETYAPNLYGIEIKKFINLPIDSGYEFSKGELGNGAKVDTSTGLVTEVGGIKNGSVKIIVNIPSNGYYDLQIKYLGKYMSRFVNMDINNITYSFTLPFNDFQEYSNESTFTLSEVYLNKDANSLKFYGNGITTVSPLDSLKIFKSVKSSTVPNYIISYAKYTNLYVKDGILQPPALISRNIPNFVENIGGPIKDGKKEGTVTIKFDNGKTSGLYNLSLEYLADTTSKNLAVDINGFYTGFLYTFPQTNGLKESDSKKFTIPIMLNVGINSIKFRGDGSNFAPKLGKFEILKISEDNLYNVSEGYLENGAKININTKFTTNLGGVNKGSSTVSTKVSNEGFYYLTIKYLSPLSDSSIKIDITNNNSINSIMPKFTKTLSNELKDVKILTLNLKLLAGTNIIKFHGEGLEKNSVCPDLESFTITTVDYVKIYDLANEGIFSRSARKSSIPGFVTGLGGIKKGSVILNIDVDIDGLYDLAFNYIEEKMQKTFTVTINEVKLPETFKLPLGSRKSNNAINTYIIPVKLKKGNNSIKFSSKRGVTFGPIIGQVTITLNKSMASNNIIPPPTRTTIPSATTNTIPISNNISSNALDIFSVADGVLKNGAIVDTNTKMVTNIGGKNNGEVTVYYAAPISAYYNMEVQVTIPIQSRNNLDVCRLLLDINGVSTKREYYISATLLDKLSSEQMMSTKEPEVEILTVKVFLNEGKNSIRFYGNGINAGPMIGKYGFIPISKAVNLKAIELSPKGLYYLNYDFADGILGNGATIDPDTGFITNIGGKNNGFVVIEIYVYEEGIYTIMLEYLSFDDINTFTMELNDIPTGNIFNLEKCISYSNIQSFSEKLKQGKNKIKFIGDGTHNAPDLGTITFALLSKKN